MTRRICSKVKSRTTGRASWDCMSCACSFCSNIIYIPVKAICSFSGLPAPGVPWSAQVGMSGGQPYGLAKLRCEGAGLYRAPITRTWPCTDVACRDIASSKIQADSLHVMSRTSLGTVQEPLAHIDTPDPDGRHRKKVRWDSDSILEGDKQGGSFESEENTDECKVRSSCPFMSTSSRHLTPTRRRLPRRFV